MSSELVSAMAAASSGLRAQTVRIRMSADRFRIADHQLGDAAQRLEGAEHLLALAAAGQGAHRHALGIGGFDPFRVLQQCCGILPSAEEAQLETRAGRGERLLAAKRGIDGIARILLRPDAEDVRRAGEADPDHSHRRRREERDRIVDRGRFREGGDRSDRTPRKQRKASIQLSIDRSSRLIV